MQITTAVPRPGLKLFEQLESARRHASMLDMRLDVGRLVTILREPRHRSERGESEEPDDFNIGVINRCVLMCHAPRVAAARRFSAVFQRLIPHGGLLGTPRMSSGILGDAPFVSTGE